MTFLWICGIKKEEKMSDKDSISKQYMQDKEGDMCQAIKELIEEACREADERTRKADERTKEAEEARREAEERIKQLEAKIKQLEGRIEELS